jgi:hypothetical protein
MSADELVVILDRSGSMSILVDTAIKAYNEFLFEQGKVDRQANFTLVQFNHNYEIVYDGIDIKQVSTLNQDTYRPDGTTALFDAIGRGILQVTRRIAGTDSKVYFAVLTDGYENASKEFNLEQVRTLIKQKAAEGWKFFYLVAGVEQYEAEQMAQMILIDKKLVRAEKLEKDGLERLNKAVSMKMRMMRELRDDDKDLKDLNVQ